MKLIKKEELLSVICISFTLIVLSINLVEVLWTKAITAAQLNIFMAFLWTGIAVVILSLHYLLDSLSPLAMIVIQYIVATALVLLSVWIMGHFMPVSPHGYRDVFRSFSIIYAIGAVVYYVDLYLSVKRQNKTLEYIREHKN